MKVDLAGKIRNTQLPQSKPLLPMFEAVVNSFHAVEDRTEASLPGQIGIRVERDPVIPGLDVDGKVNGFTVTDNGVGFDDRNLDSFFTSDSQYKASRGGKGIGRFMWLKAFRHVEVESHYRDKGRFLARAFTFTTAGEQPAEIATDSGAAEPVTTVRLIAMQPPYKEHCPHDLALIGSRLIEHCLPFFMDLRCPTVTICDGKDRIDLNERFRGIFAAKASDHTFKVGGNAFTLRGLRLCNPHETRHRLLYAANSREVHSERLDRHLPNLQRKLTDGTDPFVYLGFVQGDYLDQSVNRERTSFSFLSDHEADGLFESDDEITLDDIRPRALDCVIRDLRPFLEEINAEKRATINAYISEEAPQYRPLSRYMDEFIDRIPPGAKGPALEAALHERMFEKERELRSESRRLLEESNKGALVPGEYEAKLNDFLERANELGKSSLAQYIVHRKVILDFLERGLQADPQTGKYPLEEIIHRIIYPMRATSDDVPYEQQNLWIIDERLTYHWFLASDKPIRTGSIFVNASSSRPDLMVFDRALTFAEDSAALGSIVIVEFKKPARTDYDEDPVDQVYRLIRDIRGGHFKDRNGREVKVQSHQIPAYGYVICDLTREVEVFAENKAMFRTPDNLGFYGYNSALSAYVEIISYAKLLGDAKKRNRVLFDKLHLPASSV